MKKYLSKEQLEFLKVRHRKEFFAKSHRANPTLAEAIFAKLSKGCYLQKQKIICGWIVDFYYPAGRIIIEIDGDSHKCTRELDELKNNRFEELNYYVLRFSDEEVFKKPNFVLQRLYEAIEFRTVYCPICKDALTINAVYFQENPCFHFSLRP